MGLWSILSKRPPFGRYFILSVSERLLYSLVWIFRARALTTTMRDHFHPPFSHCVRVTTRGQKTELILYSLKRPKTLSSAALSSAPACVWTFLKAFFFFCQKETDIWQQSHFWHILEVFLLRRKGLILNKCRSTRDTSARCHTWSIHPPDLTKKSMKISQSASSDFFFFFFFLQYRHTFLCRLEDPKVVLWKLEKTVSWCCNKKRKKKKKKIRAYQPKHI